MTRRGPRNSLRGAASCSQHSIRRLSAALVIALLTSSCVVVDPGFNARRLAQSARLQRELVQTDSFLLTSFVRIITPYKPINIYIEGDGRAWQSTTEPALDPTPHRAMALQLAAKDPAPNVVYLARPCQYTDHDPYCEVSYWTERRYSREVIAAMNEAVSHYAALAPKQPLHLIGYSGGGALAILIASRRNDISSIRTVAGNLDLDEVMRLNRVSPIPQSVNPMSAARSVARIPQIHFSGANDTIVPPAIAERFARAVGGSCVQTRVVAGMSHEGSWADIWQRLQSEMVVCGSP